MMVQNARPDSDIGGYPWYCSAGSDRFELINEVTADDTDYIYSEWNTEGNYQECGLSNLSDPDIHTGHTIRFRGKKFHSPSGSSAERMTVYLLQGSTVIWQVTQSFTSTNVWESFEYTLAEAQAANITDYTDLRIRVIANNSTAADQVYCSWVEFEVPNPIVAPTVTTQAVSNIAKKTATGNGNITSLGSPNPTAHGVCWNTTGTPTTSDSKSDEGAASSTGAFTSDMPGLNPGTLYHVRAYATNVGGTSYGNEVTFTTLIEPTVTTDPATSVEATTATLNGTLDDDGGEACDCGFEYGLDTGYGTTTPTDSKNSSEAFSQAITGLSSNTIYHFRAIATNSAGTSYGDDQTFTTLIEPTVTTDPASNIQKTTIALNGTLEDDGNEACDCGFEYGETTAYGTTTPTQSKTSGETFSQALSGLTPGAHYHFRAIATNSAGASYGSDRAFFAKGGLKGNPHIDQLLYRHVERMGR